MLWAVWQLFAVRQAAVVFRTGRVGDVVSGHTGEGSAEWWL